jgi:hypothetical protein
MINEICNSLKSVIGTKCWEATNAVTGTLRLFFGEALLVEPYPECMLSVGQYDLLIWNRWTLEEGNSTLCDDTKSDEFIARSVFQLIGDTVTNIEIISPKWDAVIMFKSCKVLKIFCEETQDSTELGNWDFAVMEVDHHFGPGEKIDKSTRNKIVPDIIFDLSILPSINIEQRINEVNRHLSREKMMEITKAIKGNRN